MAKLTGRNKHKLIGIRPDDEDVAILFCIKNKYGLSTTNAIRLALRTQAWSDGFAGVDPADFRPPQMGNPTNFPKKKPAKTPRKTAISKKSKK